MLWLFRKILDRLLVKSAVHVASELKAQIDLEVSETRATLLRKARRIRAREYPRPGTSRGEPAHWQRPGWRAKVKCPPKMSSPSLRCCGTKTCATNRRQAYRTVATWPMRHAPSSLPFLHRRRKNAAVLRKSPADDVKPSDGELPAAS